MSPFKLKTMYVVIKYDSSQKSLSKQTSLLSVAIEMLC